MAVEAAAVRFCISAPPLVAFRLYVKAVLATKGAKRCLPDEKANSNN